MSGIIGGAGSKSGVIGTTELDIEEGNFTFSIVGSGGTAGSWAQTGTTGYYRKVGPLVQFSLSGYLTNTGSYSTFLRVTGLPFVAAQEGILSISYYPSTVVDAVWRTAQIVTGQSYVLFLSGSKLDVQAPWSEITTGAYLNVGGVYPTAS